MGPLSGATCPASSRDVFAVHMGYLVRTHTTLRILNTRDDRIVWGVVKSGLRGVGRRWPARYVRTGPPNRQALSDLESKGALLHDKVVVIPVTHYVKHQDRGTPLSLLVFSFDGVLPDSLCFYQDSEGASHFLTAVR